MSVPLRNVCMYKFCSHLYQLKDHVRKRYRERKEKEREKEKKRERERNRKGESKQLSLVSWMQGLANGKKLCFPHYYKIKVIMFFFLLGNTNLYS